MTSVQRTENECKWEQRTEGFETKIKKCSNNNNNSEVTSSMYIHLGIPYIFYSTLDGTTRSVNREDLLNEAILGSDLASIRPL